MLGPEEYQALLELIAAASEGLQGRVVWNVNSTAHGGGVVELLRPLLGYSRGGGVDGRWLVIGGDPQFFEVTKRLHNRLHGFGGDRGPLGERERTIYERTLQENALELVRLVRARDVVILHDPQTAGLVRAARSTGATVIWRCHVGRDHVNGPAHEAWAFLRPYVQDADAFVFSRAAYAWEGLPEEKIAVIPPSIDAFSPKNEELKPAQRRAILSAAGIIPVRAAGKPVFTRADGTPGRVDSLAEMIQDQPLTPDDRLVVQVSRWDRLKDPFGVIRGFAKHVAPASPAHLLLAGPATSAVADDPEGVAVLEGVVRAVRGLPSEVRSRVHLASLPMDDGDENAVIVNALQGYADVVVQKSLAEGFGLTVAEAMWKFRSVVGSRVGGIEDQIVHGESGILIDNPRDTEAFGVAVLQLLSDPNRARQLGIAAHERIRENYLAPQHLGRYFELIERLVPQPQPIGVS